MMKKENTGRTTSSRKDSFAFILILTYIVMLAFRIPLGLFIGDNGNAYFSVANELCMILAGMVSFGLSEAVTVLIRYRIRREQYKSAQMVLREALFIGAVIGLLFMAILGIGGSAISAQIVKLPLAGLSVRMMAPALFFTIETGVFRGYFQGNGSQIPSMHSKIIHTIIYVVGGLLGAAIMKDYGQKVAALLQNANHTAAYGAMGASIGILIASVLCFLHMLILFVVFSRESKRQRNHENVRNLDSRTHILYMITGTGIFHSLFWLLCSGQPLLDQQLFFRFQKNIENMDLLWGIYYGKYLVLIGIPSLLILLLFISSICKIMALFEREDYRVAREKLGILIHQCAVVACPVAIFTAVFAENILNIIWKGNNQETATWIQLGSILIILMSFSAVFMEMIQKIKRVKAVLLISGIAFVVKIVITCILLINTNLGIKSLVIGNIVFFAGMAMISFWMLSSMLQYRQEWFRCFAITIIASAVSGVIAALLNKVFYSLLGSMIALIIGLVVAVICYLIFLVIGRGFTEEEMYSMPGGKLLLFISSWFPFL